MLYNKISKNNEISWLKELLVEEEILNSLKVTIIVWGKQLYFEILFGANRSNFIIDEKKYNMLSERIN